MASSPTVRPRRGLSLRDSTTLSPGTYAFCVGEDEPVITVRADGAVIDCSGVRLCGAESAPDARRGVAIRVINSRRVRIVGLAAMGFQVGVHVLNSTEVVIDGVAVTGTRHKGVNEEDPDDPVNWIDLFDKAGWRQYGTGIWIERCQGATIRDCRVTDAQNGITLDKTDEAAVLNNDCSRNAGWGIHLDRASRCTVVSNRCGECARPGDQVLAAGIAINNGCHRNDIVSNEIPGCTYGIVLTARYNEQSNGNLIASNDIQGSVQAAIEVAYCDDTRIMANRVRGARYGLYLDHLRRATVQGNTISECTIAGVLVSHGVGVELVENAVQGCPRGIHQVGSGLQGRPPTDCRIEGNVLQANGTAIVLDSGWRTRVLRNYDAGNGSFVYVADECVGSEIV